MTNITNYFLTRLDDSGNAQVTILSGSYAAIQLYVDNALIIETASMTFKATVPVNKKIDVLGISSGERGTDFSDQLSDEFGDKVEFTLPNTFGGRPVHIYTDYRTGTIDFGRPFANGVASVAAGGVGWAAFDEPQWNAFSESDWDQFSEDGASNAKLTIGRRLPIGTYRFALVNFNLSNNYHDPYIITQTIRTRPDEITPFIDSFDKGLDELTIATDDDGRGTYTIYAAPWGSPATAINFTIPLGQSSVSPIVIYGARGLNTNTTRYLAIRKTVNGVEEQNWNVIAFTLVGSEWVGSYPDAPSYLTGAIAESDTVLLSYRFSSSRPCDGFNIYAGVGSVDYSTPIKTITNNGRGSYRISLPIINATTLYGVRAFTGAMEEQNTTTVSVSPLDALVQVTGAATATWSEA